MFLSSSLASTKFALRSLTQSIPFNRVLTSSCHFQHIHISTPSSINLFVYSSALSLIYAFKNIHIFFFCGEVLHILWEASIVNLPTFTTYCAEYHQHFTVKTCRTMVAPYANLLTNLLRGSIYPPGSPQKPRLIYF